MESLMTEFHEDQKARNDLFKWKLVAIGTIGSVGLGFSGASTPSLTPTASNVSLVLALIPFVCVYTDLLCRNLSIRIQTRASFMTHEAANGTPSMGAKYLKFYYVQRPTNGSSLESLALIWSTVFLSFITAIAGLVLFSSNSPMFWLLISAGMIGVLLSILVEKNTNLRNLLYSIL